MLFYYLFLLFKPDSSLHMKTFDMHFSKIEKFKSSIYNLFPKLIYLGKILLFFYLKNIYILLHFIFDFFLIPTFILCLMILSVCKYIFLNMIITVHCSLLPFFFAVTLVLVSQIQSLLIQLHGIDYN